MLVTVSGHHWWRQEAGLTREEANLEWNRRKNLPVVPRPKCSARLVLFAAKRIRRSSRINLQFVFLSFLKLSSRSCRFVGCSCLLHCESCWPEEYDQDTDPQGRLVIELHMDTFKARWSWNPMFSIGVQDGPT